MPSPNKNPASIASSQSQIGVILIGSVAGLAVSAILLQLLSSALQQPPPSTQTTS